jgi:type IV pilus assembly protein PilM
MATPRFAWGIDIGNRALKAVKLVRGPEGLKVDDFELIEHETVLSNAGDNREALVQTALANFIARHPFKGGSVAVGVSGQSSFARFIKLPPVEPKKIPEIVRFEAIQQIPFPLDDVEWSYQLFQTPDSPDVEVGIFAMRKELVNRFIRDFTDFDLNVQVVQMNPLAVYNALYQDNRFNGTTMVMDMGAENTDLIIADNDTIWMRSIPIGGNNFTQTLEKAFKLPFAKAEELKRNSATSKYARQIFQAMRPIFADLVAEIQRSMGFYASVHRDSRIKKIIALGGTFKLPGLQKYLQQNLQLDIEGIDSLGAAGPGDAKQAAFFNENLRASAAAYGLAVQAMGDGKIGSSLLPTAIRREKMWKEKTKWFGAAAALFVVGSGIAVGRYAYENLQFQQHADDRTAINSISSQANGLDQSWQTIADSGADDRQQILNVRQLTQYRTLWLDMLNDLQKAIPAPPPALQTALILQNKDQLTAIPRDQRNVILIDSIASKFYGDLNSVLIDPQFSRFVIDNPSGAGGFMDLSQLSAGAGGASGGMMPGGPDAGAGGPPGLPPYAQNGGGPPPGMGGPTPDQSGAPGAATPPGVPGRGGPNSRGFVITLKCTSPDKDAVQLVYTQLLGNLMKIWPDANRPQMEYGVAKAMMVSANQIKDDQTRLSALRDRYQNAVRAQLLADQQAAAAKALAQQALGANGNRPGLPPAYNPGQPFNPGQPGGFGGGFNPNGADPNSPQVDPNEAFKDRLTGEDMRKDWEFTVLFAVQLDPPAPTPATPGAAPAAAPAAPQAAAQ